MDTLTYLANYVNAQDFRRSQQIQHALQLLRGVVPRCAGGAMAPPDFSRSVNPISTSHSVRFGRFLSKNYFSFKKAVNLSSKSLLALTKQVLTCFEDFINIS